MKSQPELTTKRLTLRAFTVTDSSRVRDLAGNKLIADVTANIPHPYPESLAKEWIQSHPKKWKNKERKWMRLFTGIVMVALGILLIIWAKGIISFGLNL